MTIYWAVGSKHCLKQWVYKYYKDFIKIMTFTSWTFTLLKSLKSCGKEAYKETIITQHDNCSDGWIQKAWEEQKEE